MTRAARLLSWYRRVRRDLPWRRRRDAYAIWVSEVMLQQTRVEVVEPYYQRFLACFPRVEDLAAASVEEVLAAWSGLGYYRRARQLHQAAAEVVRRGGFPRRAEELERLPGIGPYTAAAVASIAFGEAVPVLDGNVARVLSRLAASSADPRLAAVRRRLLAAAAELLAPGSPGESNQALMELGATVCTPRAPRCSACPLAAECRGRAAGRPEAFPGPRTRPRRVALSRLLAVVIDDGRLLLIRRPEESAVLAGTWELPWVERAAPAAAAAAFGERYGGRWEIGGRRARVRHAITFRDLTLTIREARVERLGRPEAGFECGWFTRRELAALPHSSLVPKALAAGGWLEA